MNLAGFLALVILLRDVVRALEIFAFGYEIDFMQLARCERMELLGNEEVKHFRWELIWLSLR